MPERAPTAREGGRPAAGPAIAAAEAGHGSCLAGSFRPAFEAEGMRKCRKAALESTHSEWFKRYQERFVDRDRRRMHNHVEDTRSTRRLFEDSMQHHGSMSARDCGRMLEAVSFDSDLASRTKQFREEVNVRTRSARTDYEQTRCRARQLDLHFAGRQNDILAQAARIRHELNSNKVSTVEDIRRECRQHRRMAPGSPHSPRPTFRRLEVPQLRSPPPPSRKATTR
mmetsp:Transcript_69328/g.224118  ORF Transcript_69328/g.224118 Transcript_69328/m.224118 type:complete len:226 (-) Transcript_69328:107-784(-)